MSGDQGVSSGASSQLQASIANGASAQQSGAGKNGIFEGDIGKGIDESLGTAFGESPLGLTSISKKEITTAMSFAPPGVVNALTVKGIGTAFNR